MNTISIVGLGLMGGSLAKAIKRSHPTIKINAYDYKEDSLIQAKKDGTIDAYTLQVDQLIGDGDLIILCLPVERNLEIIQSLTPYLKEDCIISDVSSTKSHLNEYIKDAGLNCTFIGGHPMAGSEKTGYEASKAHLFENAYYILCPYDDTPDEKVTELSLLVESIGAIPLAMDAKEHDYVTSIISHLPHLLASTLVYHMSTLAKKQPLLKDLAAGGFKDITRIASANPDMWLSIFKTNREQIHDQLEAFIHTLENAKILLSEENHEDLHNYLVESKDFRDRLSSPHHGVLPKTYALRADVSDQPGVISHITTLLYEGGINIKNIGIFNYREHISGILEISFGSQEDLDLAYDIIHNAGYEVFY